MREEFREKQIDKFTLDALLQVEAVTPCVHHNDVLLHTGDDGTVNMARLRAIDWLNRDGKIGKVIR